MTGEQLSTNACLWTCAWQSTVCITAGLIGSFLLRRHSARAHRVLFLAIVAAAVVPVRRLASDVVLAIRTRLPASQRGLEPSVIRNVWYFPPDYPHRVRASARDALGTTW